MAALDLTKGVKRRSSTGGSQHFFGGLHTPSYISTLFLLKQ